VLLCPPCTVLLALLSKISVGHGEGMTEAKRVLKRAVIVYLAILLLLAAEFIFALGGQTQNSESVCQEHLDINQTELLTYSDDQEHALCRVPNGTVIAVPVNPG